MIFSNRKPNHDKFKSNPNHIICFQIKSCSSQIKSPHVIQSWFKSNNNLDLPVSSTHFNHTLTSRNHHCYWKTAISRHQDHHHLLDWEKYHNDNLRSTTLAINRRNNSSLDMYDFCNVTIIRAYQPMFTWDKQCDERQRILNKCVSKTQTCYTGVHSPPREGVTARLTFLESCHRADDM